MGKVFFTMVALVASLVVAESLICNNCAFSVLGYCLNPTNVTCAENVTQCFVTTLTFPDVTNFTGFTMHGCAVDNITCGRTEDRTFLVAKYKFNNTCCTTNRCNTIVSGAPTTKMTFSAAIIGTILASVLGSMF